MPILLTDQRLRDALYPRPFRFFARSGSTNDLAAVWASESAPVGAVVVTEEQYGGRGRFERAWFAPAGTALLFSVVLRPRIASERLPRVTMVGAVALLEALGDLFGDRLTLKWPNDVLLDGRKLAGILPEALWRGETLDAVIVGVGLNVRIDFGGSPLAQTAISITDVTERTIDRTALLAAILRRIDHWAVRIDDPALWEAWRARLVTLGQQVQVHYEDGQVIAGHAADVDPNGALQLIDQSGALHRILGGEVTLRPLPSEPSSAESAP